MISNFIKHGYYILKLTKKPRKKSATNKTTHFFRVLTGTYAVRKFELCDRLFSVGCLPKLRFFEPIGAP